MFDIRLLIKRMLVVITGILLSGLFLFYIANINLTAPPPRKDSIIVTNSLDNIIISATPEPHKAESAPSCIEAESSVSSENSEMDPTNVIDGWVLAFYDDFTGPELDAKKWSPLNRKDSFNNELQYYCPDNAFVKDSCLYLTAKKEKKEDKAYTSALVDTFGNFSFCYGKVEVRLKLPEGKGLFPAIWLLPEKEGKDFHEIDIMEMLGQQPGLIYGVCHYSKNGTRYSSYESTEIYNPEGFHTYVFQWSKDKMQWYIDDELFFSTDKGIPNEKMYIIMNLAVGGNWPKNPNKETPFPNSLVIDYVKVYKQYKLNF